MQSALTAREHHHVLRHNARAVVAVVVLANCSTKLRVTPRLGIQAVLRRDLHAPRQGRAPELVKWGCQREALAQQSDGSIQGVSHGVLCCAQTNLAPRMRALFSHVGPERILEFVQGLQKRKGQTGINTKTTTFWHSRRSGPHRCPWVDNCRSALIRTPFITLVRDVNSLIRNWIFRKVR